ncbi:hypothetical protein [Telmatospirillum siberiense]|uniref:Uncharacterized protein n=1 Tax=Telmatospirillum siberiense TaxID=382514 RepID=A0A2N3Q1N8_9PROT|nr:hypothetical protein [Telmatospirillum siberiense]PKU26563.1 hypothetical protein CWS72_01620 [Telmatospirillum siberiense]
MAVVLGLVSSTILLPALALILVLSSVKVGGTDAIRIIDAHTFVWPVHAGNRDEHAPICQQADYVSSATFTASWPS